jgi:hypothetical protein
MIISLKRQQIGFILKRAYFQYSLKKVLKSIGCSIDVQIRIDLKVLTADSAMSK